MPPKRTLKFLCLHGHAMNPAVFEKRIGAVRSDLKKLGVEFIFGQGPIIPPQDWMDVFPKKENENGENAAAAAEKEKIAVETSKKAEAVEASSSEPPSSPQQQQDPVYSWFDFWSWKRNGMPKPAYFGCADTIKALHKLSTDQGPFDGILAFSQGTGCAALWLALEAQELRRMAAMTSSSSSDDEKKASSDDGDNNAANNNKNVFNNTLNVDDNLPLDEWRIPSDMFLLRPKTVGAANNNSTATTTTSTTSAAVIDPFLLVNVSGVIQRDDEFGGFVMKNLASLVASQRALFDVKNNSNNNSSDNNNTAAATSSSIIVPHLPLRPLHVLNVFGTADAVVLPEATQIMTNLYGQVCGSKATSASTATTITLADSEEEGSSQSQSSATTTATGGGGGGLAFGGNSSEWSHEGGHVVPSSVRKPLKALIEELYGK